MSVQDTKLYVDIAVSTLPAAEDTLKSHIRYQ
jgi:hypothetical protein